MARYNLAQRLIHWTVALLVGVSLAVGMTIGAYDGFGGLKDAFGVATTNLIYKYHKTSGVLILALMTIRFCLRLAVGKPKYTPPLPAGLRLASTAAHWALYAALLAMPVLGWMATASGGFPIEFFELRLPGLIGKDKALSEQLFDIHEFVGDLILVLLVLHVGAAIWHWRVRRDGVMQRISLP